jgi:anti-sigma B factor antagonist
MSLSIEIRRSGHIVILELAGRVSVLEPSLKALAEDLIMRGERYFIINLANVSYLDNFGLGQLCWLYTVSRNRGGDMKLLKPTTRIRTLLSITKLNTVLQSFDFEADAVASMPIVTSSVSA